MICDARGRDDEQKQRDLPGARKLRRNVQKERCVLINGRRRGSGRRLRRKHGGSWRRFGVSKEEGGACSKAATKNTNAISGHRRKVKAC